ncbi:MAG TPA: SDR family oxidoreductase [Candidatus Krumholzibacteria bacterium]|nr:SDR family oxidoreductase [Candidatus Krumholzibacteria bacterium]
MSIDTTILRDRHAIITGAGSGIGAAVARELAKLGAHTTLIGRRIEPLNALRLELERSAPGRPIARAADVTDPSLVERAIRDACAMQGDPFVLVNNAGAALSAPFLETSDDDWRAMLDVNVMGAVFCTRAVLPLMRAQRDGRIINMASTAGVRGYPYVAAYTAAKHALVGLTRALACEIERDGLTANALCPAYTNTEMLGVAARRTADRTGRSEADVRAKYAAANAGGRLVEPHEVAGVAAWLCAPEQRDVTGRAIVIDGVTNPFEK